MSKIKVTVNNLSQLNEIIEYWNGKDVELSIEVKENTATENSDVKEKSARHLVASHGKLVKMD